MSATLTPQLSGPGPLIPTRARAEDFPSIGMTYRSVSQVVRESGLLRRAYWFYISVAVLIAAAFIVIALWAHFAGVRS